MTLAASTAKAMRDHSRTAEFQARLAKSQIASFTKQTDMQPADEIIDGLWMGDVRSAKLAATGVGEFDAIVNLTGDDTDWAPKRDNNRTYVNFHFGDGALPDLDQLDALVEYIAALLVIKTSDHQRRVLVHCTMGVNRSGLVCALVVRRVTGRTGMEALRLVREKRDLCGNVFFSPGTGDRCEVAVGNTLFARYVESLP